MKKLVPVWGLGCLMLVLRCVEKRTGFDAASGVALAVPVRGILIAAVALAVVYAVLVSFRKSGEKPEFAQYFAQPGMTKGALTAGSFLVLGGGVLMGMQALTEHAGAATLATAGFAAATGLGLVLLTAQMSRGGAEHVAPLLPALFFNAFWVLDLYLPAGSDPILARYWLPILAAAMNAYAFAQLAGFFRGESKPRSFACVARIAVMLCIAGAAENGLACALLFAGNAVVLSSFIALEKE